MNLCKTLALFLLLVLSAPAIAGQVPGKAGALDVPVTSVDRVYTAEQFSNTVSVIDPATNHFLGQIRLGDPQPANLSPLYKGQLLVHGLGFSPDGRTLAVVSIGSNSVTLIDTASNTVKQTVYLGRSPHEAFFTPDGKELWVTVRGQDYVQVLDTADYSFKTRVTLPAGPGMQIFSPDGKYAYVCSSFNPETDVVEVASHAVVARVKQESPFCPNIAATPEGDQVWLTLKDIGHVMVFDGRPPFAVLKTIDSGPITNHVNIVRNIEGRFAYVTVGGRNLVQVYRTDTFEQVASIPVGALPHGVWPSGDGTRVYIGNENDDTVSVIDTHNNQVISTIAVGQAPQALVYVPRAGDPEHANANLQPLGLAGQAGHLSLADATGGGRSEVALFDQGLTQVLQVSAVGLTPKKAYLLGLASASDGSGSVQPLARFMTNPAGAAVFSAVGPIRQMVESQGAPSRRWLVIAKAGADGEPAGIEQVQR